MDIKKSPKADLENKKSIFNMIGLVIVLGLVFIAFEWTTTDVDVSQFEMQDGLDAEEEIIPITRQEEVKPPPPPPPPKVTDVLNIVEDDVELDEELDIEDTEMDEDSEIDFADIAVDEEEEEDAPVFYIVEDMPEFPGGESALHAFISKSVKYPVIAQENGIQGRVYISFVINAKGLVESIKIARGVDPALDKEAVRVIKSMPKWKPGKQRGKPVKVSFTVPINFVLQ